MSMAADHITCTGCTFKGIKQYRPLSLIYHFPDGSEVKTGRIFGWCAQCKKIKDIEPTFDTNEIMSNIAVLQRKGRSPARFIGHALDRMLGGRGGKDEKEELANLQGQLRIAETRRSMPRCLTCGSDKTQYVAFNANGLSENFIHECGGRLRVEPPDLTAPMFSYRPETIHLDVEGRRMDTGQPRIQNPLQATKAPEQTTPRDPQPHLADHLVNQAIGGQSVMYGMFTKAFRCDESSVRRIELTYFAAAVMTYVYLRFGLHPNKKDILDEFTRRILAKSLPASRARLTFSESIEQYQVRFAEYSSLLNPLLGAKDSTPTVTLLMHLFESVTGNSPRGRMIEITAAAGLMHQFVIDHIDFVKKEEL